MDFLSSSCSSVKLFLSSLLQHGLMKTADEEYFIEPLDQYSSTNLYSEGHPHIVYKRSSLPRPKNLQHHNHHHNHHRKDASNSSCSVSGKSCLIFAMLLSDSSMLSKDRSNFSERERFYVLGWFIFK